MKVQYTVGFGNVQDLATALYELGAWNVDERKYVVDYGYCRLQTTSKDAIDVITETFRGQPDACRINTGKII